jgi:hypothetical protein
VRGVKLVAAILCLAFTCAAGGAVEIDGWGDLRGFRIDGELMRVNTSLVMARPDWKEIAFSGHWQEKDLHHFSFSDHSVFSGVIAFAEGGSLEYKYAISDLGDNRVRIDLTATPQSDLSLNGIYFTVSTPLAEYAAANAQLLDAAPPTTQSAFLASVPTATERQYLNGRALGVDLTAAHRRLDCRSDVPLHVTVRDTKDKQGDEVNLLFLLHPGDCKKGQEFHASFTIAESGLAGHSPATLTLDPSRLGGPFNGIGGNLVWDVTSPISLYNLKHLNVVSSRIGMFLTTFAPRDAADFDSPDLSADTKQNVELRQSLELGRTLAARKIPIIMSLWVAPAWALSNPDPADDYAHGRIINPQKWNDLARAIGSYLLYAKRQYGFDVDLFSFNESDLGVTIKLTPEEQRDAIKRLGAYFASIGLPTRLLLGDVSNPGPANFIDATAVDPAAMRYVGAISYHSWNGGTPEQLTAWHTAAVKLGVPLLVDEGGMDPEVYHYRFIGDEPWYAFDEGALYLDVLARSQPAAILTWQLTPDFALEDIDAGELRPTRRFWFLKQLSETTPAGSLHCPIIGDCPSLHAAAFYQRAGGEFVIQIINTGSSRPVTIAGIPDGIAALDCYGTDTSLAFQKVAPANVAHGTATFEIPPMCFMTLAGRTAATEKTSN